MSEYQYYEFLAIDRPLTDQEQGTLRKYSSRATITSSRFVVNYSWGGFRGNAADWMEKYFDAFLHLANWGTHELMLRLPQNVLPLVKAKQYCAGDSASARAKGGHLVLSFRSDDEEGGEWVDEDNDTLASLLPVRTELASGDLRALYLTWLGCAGLGELEDEDPEPPCPPGLGKLSADDAALERWVTALPEAEKTSILARLREEHARKPSLIERLRKAGLAT